MELGYPLNGYPLLPKTINNPYMGTGRKSLLVTIVRFYAEDYEIENRKGEVIETGSRAVISGVTEWGNVRFNYTPTMPEFRIGQNVWISATWDGRGRGSRPIITKEKKK